MALIEIRNLVKRFHQKDVLCDISLDVELGSTRVIMGPSGCGKTTLIRCLNRLVEADSGLIYFEGQNIMSPQINLSQLRQKIGFVFQNFVLYRHLTVLNNVTLGLRVLKNMSTEKAKEKALLVLEKFDMHTHQDKFPSQISGGQKQRVALARAMAMDSKILVFDEPPSALDPVKTRSVAQLINKLRDENITLICVTHDVLLAEQISDNIIFLDHGVIKADGSIASLKRNSDPAIREFFG